MHCDRLVPVSAGVARRVVRRCPSCGSSRVVPIVYGLPDDDLMCQANNGRVVLGGCCVTGDDPQWHCQRCGYEWSRPADAV